MPHDQHAAYRVRARATAATGEPSSRITSSSTTITARHFFRFALALPCRISASSKVSTQNAASTRDAHALLMAIYKIENVPIEMRLDAAKSAVRYEKPALSSVDQQGRGQTAVRRPHSSPHRQSRGMAQAIRRHEDRGAGAVRAFAQEMAAKKMAPAEWTYTGAQGARDRQHLTDSTAAEAVTRYAARHIYGRHRK